MSYLDVVWGLKLWRAEGFVLLPVRKFGLFGGIVQSSSCVVIAVYSNQLTTVGDHFDNNQQLMNVRRQHFLYNNGLV